MKRKLISLAVSSALVAPLVALSEDSGPELYGRINLAIAVNDSAEDTTSDLFDVVSRFGIRGEEDLGNGLAAVYQYEFRVNADRGSIRADADAQRLTYVGLKGGFGQITAGSIWGTWINTVGTYLDPTYTLGYFGYSTYASADYRIESAIQYSGNFGPLSISADVQIDGNKAGDDNIDRWVVGANYNTGPVTVGVAYDEERLADQDAAGNNIEGDDTHTRTGVALSYDAGQFTLNLGWINSDNEQNDTDRDFWTINGRYKLNDSNNVYLSYWNGDGDDDDVDGDGVVLGYYHSLSARTKLYFEGHNGEVGDSDNDIYLLGLRHDF